jgi:amino acid efflux transporter
VRAADQHRDSKSEIGTCAPADLGGPDPAATRGSIGTVQGTMLYVGAVLGSSVLLIPALAMRKAGPASVPAWAALILLSIPLAYTFAGVATRFPGAGGVAERAFGSRASVCVGWTMYGGALLCVPPEIQVHFHR